MGGPLLPKFALAFAEQLAEGIEAEYAGGPGQPVVPPKRGFLAFLRRLLRILFRGSSR
jgi:hypothetical protein